MAIDPYGKVRPRRPSLKGSVMLDVTRGAQRARVWPAKRGKPKTQEEADRQERFRMIQYAVKFLPAIQQQQYREACEGTALLPRDLLTMAMYGRFCAIKRPDGRIIYPMTARQDISESLDVLDQVPGTMLYRGVDYWEAVPPGQPGDVLVYSPDLATPQWGPGAAPYSRQGAKMLRTTNLSVPASTDVPVPWDTEKYDTSGYWDPADPTRITIPSGGAGVYLFTAGLRYNQGSGAPQWCYVRKNNTVIIGGQNVYYPSGTVGVIVGCAVQDEAVPGDYYQVYARSTTVTRNLEPGGNEYCHVEIARMM